MRLPPPSPGNLARQVDLLRAMGGLAPVPGYSAEEQAVAAGRIARALARSAGQLQARSWERAR
ncbi:hypothetical protein [Methylorubrum sp. DB1722]|uniref:hypothetical protein n=1 Tax=Methylorubrum sp. DB1722 TaxID=2478916 RepID=UPI0018E39A05|nr:hypothetical protein [Methylorubrum sp. DB1722]MBI1689505.1 hypothetical protein [Methylorubrum sp. DB1722]